MEAGAVWPAWLLEELPLGSTLVARQARDEGARDFAGRVERKVRGRLAEGGLGQCVVVACEVDGQDGQERRALCVSMARLLIEQNAGELVLTVSGAVTEALRYELFVLVGELCAVIAGTSVRVRLRLGAEERAGLARTGEPERTGCGATRSVA